MRISAMISVVWLMIISGMVSASDRQLEALFPNEGLRYKSCQIKLNPADDGYIIDIKRDCHAGPESFCYNYQQQGSVEVNSQQIEVFGKTLTNYHKIGRSSKTTKLEVKEYGKWNEQTSLGVLGSSSSVLVGSFQTKLELRIDNATGQVEKFKAYSKGSLNLLAALRGGILSTINGLYAITRKKTMVDCNSPGQVMHFSLIYLLEEIAYEKVLSDAKREAMDAKLLQQLSVAKEDDYLEVMFGNTPLHYAAKHGFEKFARRLIPLLPQEAKNRATYKLGNPINFQNSKGDTPLHLAVERGQVGMVKLLLATEGIDTSITNYHWYESEKTAKQMAIANVTKHCEADTTSQDCKKAQEIVLLFAE